LDYAEGLSLAHMAQLSPAQMDRLTRIYLDSFGESWDIPVDKLPEFVAQRAEGQPSGRALALLRDDVPVSLALTSYLRESNYLYLLCLATDEHHRNGGLGGKMLRAVTQIAEEMALAEGHSGCRGTLAEVETLDGPPPRADRRLRARRIGFYQRHGAVATGVFTARPPWARPQMPVWEVMLLPGRAWTLELDGPTLREMAYALMVEGCHFSPQADWLIAYLDRIHPLG